ncbi:hypothetical protein BN1723_019776, partial [Verticillium longisporum]
PPPLVAAHEHPPRSAHQHSQARGQAQRVVVRRKGPALAPALRARRVVAAPRRRRPRRVPARRVCAAQHGHLEEPAALPLRQGQHVPDARAPLGAGQGAARARHSARRAGRRRQVLRRADLAAAVPPRRPPCARRRRRAAPPQVVRE